MVTGFREEFGRFIRLLIEKIKDFYGERLVSVVLYGSQARETQRPDSDIDLLIILSDAPRGRQARIDEFLLLEEKLEPELAKLQRKEIFTFISPVIKTRDEISRGSPLLIDMTEDARILYDQGGFMQKLLDDFRERLKKLGAKRVWLGSGWYWILKPDLKDGEIIDL